MRIGLISPRSTIMSRTATAKSFFDATDILASFRKEWSGLSGALPLIAALTPPEHSISLVDENVEELDLDAPYDLVGITLMTHQADRAYEIADAFRKRGVHVALGGIHATVLPNEAREHAQTVFVGEAEATWPAFLSDFAAGHPKAIYEASEPADLTQSPMPRYDLVTGKGYQKVWVQTTRGCPHSCEFCACSTVYGHAYRHKSVSQVVAELTRVKELFGPISIGFADDNMLVKRRFAKELLRQIIPLKLRWVAQTDLAVAEDDELLDLVSQSGCSHLFIGLESLSKKNIDGLSDSGFKSRIFKRYGDYIERIQSRGVGVLGAFIVGLDDDDETVFDELADFIIDNNMYDAQAAILTPLPGTRLRDRLEREKRILPTPWKNYTLIDVNIVHPRLTKEQLEEGALHVWRRINDEEVYLAKMVHFKQIHKQLALARS